MGHLDSIASRPVLAEYLVRLMNLIPLARSLALLALLITTAAAQDARTNKPPELLSAGFTRLLDILEPPFSAPTQTFAAEVKVVRAAGVGMSLGGRSAQVACQAPDRLTVSAEVDGNRYALGRFGQQLWMYNAAKKFGVVGEPGQLRFKSAPGSTDDTRLGALKLPLPRELVQAVPLLMKVEMQPDEMIGDTRCYVVRATPDGEANPMIKLPPGEWRVALRATDLLPLRIGFQNRQGADVLVELTQVKITDPVPAARWQIPAQADDKVEKVAVSHLTKLLPLALEQATQNIPTLPPATGARAVVATEGEGRLELWDGTRVLFLKGTPEDMGRQHGTLLKRPIRNLVDRVLYGVGVAGSLPDGKWFFGEIESAQSRLLPFMDPRYLREMDALAVAANVPKEEVRLANFFPELFHCSGFALYGTATEGGRMYHGRVLDYLRGMGLEQNAVVMVFQPDQGHAWVNVGYAGFVGSVTAMNERHIAIGEMGGRGEGNWDGKPMAQLVREVMEKAGTIEEAVAIMRQSPRTCEYYYVISDGKAKRAVGIAATPTSFETIWAGESHPKLPHAIKDVVLMSAGDRYEKLAERVKAKLGQFDAESARDLMTRPVSMNSNIHSVLFAADTLDFWVANADSKRVASAARYTHYNLGEMLKAAPEK